MADNDLSLMAHLMRRAGFGAPRDELERRLATGYEATVEELLHPEDQEPVDFFEFLRYHPNQWKPGTLSGIGHSGWVYRMINTTSPLQEKVTLFWHQVFATGVSKVDHWHEVSSMVDRFREKGMGKFGDILTQVAKSPAMIFWLDNNENHSYAINENWGRELLELFSLGVGSYNEQDVYGASQAFTGWTMPPTLPRFTMGRFDWHFEYKPEDHDESSKTFIGHTGILNGEDVIDIILRQPACARFIARHLYNFFVADEPPVPAWPIEPPRDPAAIDTLVTAHPRVRLRHSSHNPPVVQLRVLQGLAVHQGQEPRRDGGKHPTHGWERRVPRPGGAGLCRAHEPHGPGAPQPTDRRGVAHREGVDQHRLARQEDQLLRRGPW